MYLSAQVLWGGGAIKQGIHAILQVEPDLQAAPQVKLPVHCLYKCNCVVTSDFAIGMLTARKNRTCTQGATQDRINVILEKDIY